MTEQEAMIATESVKATLLATIEHNLTKPKPHHKNIDLMTTLLQMEIGHVPDHRVPA